MADALTAGARLRMFREAAGKSRPQLSGLMGCSAETVKAIEVGRRELTLTMAVRAARARYQGPLGPVWGGCVLRRGREADPCGAARRAHRPADATYREWRGAPRSLHRGGPGDFPPSPAGVHRTRSGAGLRSKHGSSATNLKACRHTGQGSHLTFSPRSMIGLTCGNVFDTRPMPHGGQS